MSVYLIDGNSLIYQVFHAVPPMTGPGGQPTNAIYGIAGDIIRLKKQNPEYIICVFDPPGPTFRDKLYTEYKAHRSPMPDDLAAQLPGIRKMLEAMNIPVVVIEGYEADDVLATLARSAEKEGHQVFVVTSDKDCRQLISDKISLYNCRKEQTFGREELKLDWGIEPGQVVDLLALSGDSVDNVPGIPGVGYKTASKLLQEHKTVEGVIAAIPAMKKSKLKENLETHQEVLKISKPLVRLEDAVPLDVDWHRWKLIEPDSEKLLKHYGELGFNRYANEFRAEQFQKNKLASAGPLQERVKPGFTSPRTSIQKPKPVEPDLFSHIEEPVSSAVETPSGWQANYQLIDTPMKLVSFMQKLRQQKRFAIDLETTSLSPHQAEIVGIALCWKAGEAYYLALRGPNAQPTLDQKETFKHLQPLLEDPSIQKLNQNIKYDSQVLRLHGIQVNGIAGDSMLADYLLHAGERSHNLDDLARRHLNHDPIPITSLIGEGKHAKRMDQINTADVAQYASEDADIAWRLCELLEPQLAEQDLTELYQHMELPLIDVLAEMELNGIRLDVPFLQSLSVDFQKQMDVLTQEIYDFAGHPFNIDSPTQLRQILFDEMKLPRKRKTALTKTASTGQDVLEELAAEGHLLPGKIIAYRQLAKLKGTYVDALPELIEPKTGRLHCQFNQAVAATGRLSSSNPNLQNIPMRTEQGRQIRKAFLPEAGWHLLTADYSQIELRVFAHLSEDPELLTAFKEDRDIHAFVAGQVFGVEEKDVTKEQRRIAKVVNFGVLYGLSSFGLARTLDIEQEEAGKFIDQYFARYPGVIAFQESVLENARRDGYVSTITGRKRTILGLRARSNYRNRLQPEREAINTVIQGSAADLMKKAMLLVHRRMKEKQLESRMLLQIHDELVFEVPPKELETMKALVQREMAGAMELRVPLGVDVSVGENWLD